MTHSNLSSSTLANTAIGSASTLSSSVALSGRILLSAIFLLSGVSKIGASAGMIAYIESVGLPFRAWRWPSPSWWKWVGGSR